MRRFLATACLATLALLSACASSGGSRAGDPGAPASRAESVVAQALFADLGRRADAAEAIWYDNTLRDSLPNRLFGVLGGSARPVNVGIVLGTVTAVEEGPTYGAGDGPAQIVDPAGPDALWRAEVLTVAVEDSFGSVSGETVSVGVSVNASLDESEAKSLVGQRVVVVLRAPGFYRFDASLYGVAHSGALLGLVSSTGELRFPALGESEEAYLGDITDVERLAQAAREPVTQASTG